jgi:hypothetical protein
MLSCCCTLAGTQACLACPRYIEYFGKASTPAPVQNYTITYADSYEEWYKKNSDNINKFLGGFMNLVNKRLFNIEEKLGLFMGEEVKKKKKRKTA